MDVYAKNLENNLISFWQYEIFLPKINMSSTIGIVGYGYVGKGISKFLFKDDTSYFTVYDTYFPAGDSYTSLNNSGKLYQVEWTSDIKNLGKCDFIFICVPTPEKETGECDSSIVESIIRDVKQLKHRNKNQIFIIKSTVSIGTCKRLSVMFNETIIFNPEFSGEPKYITSHKFLTDACDSPFFIFGGPDSEARNKVCSLFQKIGGPEKKYIKTDYETAELMKTCNNAFFALKVTFCNQLFDLCEKLNIDYDELRELWLLDPRNGKDFTCVFKENRGYGGKCLPKETKSLINTSKAVNAEMTVLTAADKYNSLLKKI